VIRPSEREVRRRLERDVVVRDDRDLVPPGVVVALLRRIVGVRAVQDAVEPAVGDGVAGLAVLGDHQLVALLRVRVQRFQRCELRWIAGTPTKVTIVVDAR